MGAVIHTRECLPYQHEMIDNYLVDARQRFDFEIELKAKQKQEQIEQHEKMKRDIYLNGGFVDCVNPGCIGKKYSFRGRSQSMSRTFLRFLTLPPPPCHPFY